jgi:hypothetical protein
MKQSVVGFALGALIASGIALLMSRGPEAAPVPVASVRALEPVRAPVPAPAPEPPPEQVKPSPAAPAPVPKPRVRPVAPESAKPVAPAPAPVSAEPIPAPSIPAPPRPIDLTPPPPTPIDPPKPPAPVAKTVVIPAGTLLSARMLERVSSDMHGAGDSFAATLSEPLVVEGFVIADRNARLEGTVVESTKAGRVKGLASISVALTKLTTADGQKIAIETESFVKKGPDSKREDAAKVGVGAAIGAAIGAIAGGGKGAGIGAAAGGGAGAGKVLYDRGKPAELPVETRVSFRLNAPVTVTEKLRL